MHPQTLQRDGVGREPGQERDGSGLDEDGLVTWARDHLAGYKIPRSVSFADEIPRNGSGKIMKRDLRAPFWEGHRTGVV